MNNEQLKTEVEALINASQYEQATQLVAKELNIKLKVISSRWGKHFTDDTVSRYIFKLKLSKGRKSYTFNFGQSIAQGNTEPTMYDVLTCLQKYDVGSFEDFCSMFGYYQYQDGSKDYKQSKKTYNAVCKEYKAISRLFTDEELEILSKIN